MTGRSPDGRRPESSFKPETLQDVFYQNLNYAESGQTRPDGRPIMARVNQTFSNAIFLTNTDQGDQWTASVKGERRMRNGLFASASYLYGRSSTVNDGNSSTAFSNWRFLYTRGNSEPAGARRFPTAMCVTVSMRWRPTGWASLPPWA